ncbi:hypothetical protein QWY14_04110 [Planococcus sp. N028]|uniref:DUF2207 domain-containing protein n=1 Tax=Planococcus shixiaomingii TaxID=3058393 RepID=A0ABT8MZ79_9BACL|nr:MULTISPECIES: hypothetical protein [unclassified Planococcus (in: firmicutes)]MDN7240958.1 hypothetical protein [Planococcus sp. N028]WKA53212.1 hypothetical protein QWY21_11130 [Planococcus sp. N022]
MIKWLTCLWVGLLLFTSGIYLSTLLTTKWVVIGASLAVFGGILMGGSSYFLPKPIKK